MDECLKDVYPYSWQRKLQRASVYMKNNFGHDDIFENLSEYAVPEHFLKITKEFVANVEERVDPIPPRGKCIIDKIKDYSFAKIQLSR